MASATDYFIASSRSRMLLHAWLLVPVVVTVSCQFYGSCTGCQSVSESCSISQGSCINRLLELLPHTLLTSVTFYQTLVFTHCSPVLMTRGSCLLPQTHNKLGSRSFSPASPRLWNDLHLDYGSQDCPSTLLDNL